MMMMMLMENEFQERNNLNINDIDLSLLRLSSPPPYDHSRSSSFFSAASPPDISPLKRSSPVSDESDQPKRRRISLQDPPIFITSPLSSAYPETSNDDPTQYTYLTASQVHCPQETSVPEEHETSPSSSSKSLETEKQRMERVNNHEETKYDSYEEIDGEETKYDTYEEINREETNYDAYEHEEEEEEEDCGEGMRIERSGDGFVIRLKCRCKLAYRVLFSDHHLYFKSL